jgi:DNA-binding CsgD family transcriptional regulator
VFDTGLTIFTYTADPGTRSAEALGPFDSLAATAAADRPTLAPWGTRRSWLPVTGGVVRVALVEAVATPVFVGRDTELRILHDAFVSSCAGHSQVLVVEGEAGIGKTTLIERFLSQLPTARVLRASGDESESHVSFAMVDQLLRSEGRRSDALRAGQHVGVGLQLLELITADADDATCIVIVDDAHLIDADSLRTLLFACRRLLTSHALVAMVVRGNADEVLPEGWRKLAAGSTGNVLSLGPLAPAHISALGIALGVEMTPEAAGRLCEHTRGNPLHARAVLRELPEEPSWQYEHRPLPVPKSYAQLVRERLARCSSDVVALIEAVAVLGVRAPLPSVIELARAEHPLETLDDAIDSGLIRLDDARSGTFVEFSHPLTRVAIYEALPTARRSALNTTAARIVDDPAAAMRHRVEAATVADHDLLSDLEEHAHAEMARGAWSSAVSSLFAASRLSPLAADRDRLALEAIEATMYSGDGAAARRLAEQAGFADGPRRDSVLAYLAMFAGDVAAAQRMLTRAWDRRALVDDPRLSATIAQRSAFLSTSRLRGGEAIEWTERAMALAPDDPANGLLVAPSLALALSFTGRREAAHAALDRWLDDPSAPPHGAGFVLLALKGFLLLAEGDLRGARTAFQLSAAESLGRGLLVVAALSLSGLTRVEYVAGAWDSAVVSGERAIALAVESEDCWVVGQAHWSSSYVPSARGDWTVAEGHVRAIQEQAPTFERHVAAQAIATAGLAAAHDRPADALAALEALDLMEPADGVDDPAFLPWHHLKAHALVDVGDLGTAADFIESAATLAKDRSNPLLVARLAHARGKLAFAGRELEHAAAALENAHVRVEPLGMPYEQGLIELTQGQVLRRKGERRAAAAVLLAAHGRFSELGAEPALVHCEKELAACGLAPSARKTRDYTALTPQELAVTRLVVSGMTNREVSEELMLSTKTVEFHLSNIYTKVGVHSRSELRARARANELAI